MIENEPNQEPFAIPGADLLAKRDLMYYFKVHKKDGSSWFQPDPHHRAPEDPAELPTPLVSRARNQFANSAPFSPGRIERACGAAVR